MKATKKNICVILVSVLLVIVFFILSKLFENSANPLFAYLDGGTKVTFQSPVLKVVEWNKFIIPEGIYKKKSIYWYPHSNKSYDELWALERNSSDFEKYMYDKNVFIKN